MRFTGKELDDANQWLQYFQTGEGGYGSVYKGKLRQTAVAIKLLSQVCTNFVCIFTTVDRDIFNGKIFHL